MSLLFCDLIFNEKGVFVMKNYMCVALVGAALLFSGVSAQAASPESLAAAKSIADVCPGAWESPDCLTAVSQSNYTLVSNYGATLQQAKMDAPAETLKQKCAASTAHREQAFPAAAMKSAFIECANGISDLVDQTKVSPDLDHYQLLVAPVLCMNKDKSCATLERGLKQYQ